jgi:hypothetical protein
MLPRLDARDNHSQAAATRLPQRSLLVYTWIGGPHGVPERHLVRIHQLLPGLV